MLKKVVGLNINILASNFIVVHSLAVLKWIVSSCSSTKQVIKSKIIVDNTSKEILNCRSSPCDKVKLNKRTFRRSIRVI